MATYTKRVQAIVTEEQYELLQRLSQERRKPISVLVRQAIEREYCQKVLLEKRRRALQQLFAVEAPVADWEQMEAEIIEGAQEGSAYLPHRDG